MTIYEVIEDLWINLMPSAVITANQGLFDMLTLFITLLIIFTFILLPLWYISTFWLVKIRKNRRLR